MITPTLQSVTHVNQSEWSLAPRALSRAPLGALLHVGESHEQRGGLLKIRRTASFISISADQAWRGSPIPWPRIADGVKAIIIDPETDTVRFLPTDCPEATSSVEPSSESSS